LTVPIVDPLLWITRKKETDLALSRGSVRETAVLVLVFVPLDWFLGRLEKKTIAAMGAMTAAIALFVCGVRIGYNGERGARNDG
jgi:hypothetical protein